MLKSFLQKTNNLLQKPFFTLAPLTPESSLFQRFLHSYRDYNASSHKIRFLMTRFNRRLYNFNTLPPSSDYVMYKRAISLALVVFGSLTVYSMVEDYRASGYPFRLKEKSVKGLDWVVSKFVLYNDGLNLQTAQLLARLCDRERTQYTIMNAVSGLMTNKTIVKGASDLSLRYLHTGLLNEEFLYEKAKALVIKQFQSEDRRKDLLKILINFMKTDTAHEQFVNNMCNAFSNEGFKNAFAQKMLNEARSTLDDPNSKENAKKALQAFLATKPE